jgi:hypothetical protein
MTILKLCYFLQSAVGRRWSLLAVPTLWHQVYALVYSTGLVSGETLHELVRKVSEVKEQVSFNTQLLQELVRRQRGSEREKIGRLPSSCKLPLTTYAEVLAVEQQLKSQEFYDTLVNIPIM